MDAPIQILGVVTEEMRTPRNDGTRGSALYDVPIQLSRIPSPTWARLFEKTWDHPPAFTSRHRPGICRVIEDRIILKGTTVEEVSNTHAVTLKGVLGEVNAKIAKIERD